jgi:hypothetical protein
MLRARTGHAWAGAQVIRLGVTWRRRNLSVDVGAVVATFGVFKSGFNVSRCFLVGVL